MNPYHLRGRSDVLRRRASAEREFLWRRLEADIGRLADITEYELGFGMMLHSTLSIARYRARQQQPLAALNCLDAAIREFVSHPKWNCPGVVLEESSARGPA
ncbi:hypothetical protein AWB74_07115 [Caballeronia arvi]|uniref:Uncharacterized protein n=1 Tax=Caballeronia arvi TaxID=1777135 RepID=A0A158KW54_9BURK|nr:hypothetical protein [Caballeronia arvi]SAL84949.1 hypothetical protein AWB74_07115 [Caballeronia arvi]